MIKLQRGLLGLGICVVLSGCAMTAPQGGSQTDATAPAAAPAAMLEAPVMPAPAAIVVPPTGPVSRNRLTPQPGVVTAGDIDDTLNLESFLRFQRDTGRDIGIPAARLDTPVLVQLRGSDGQPAPGVRITLRKPGQTDAFYDGYSGVDGRAAVFPAALGQGRLRRVTLRAFPPDGGAPFETELRTASEWRALTIPFMGGWQPDFMDLVFAVDTTGSMQDELNWLAQEIGEIAAQARREAPGVDIRLGLVVYKAPADPYVVRSYGFTRDTGEFTRWVQSERAAGGAGGPEVVADALTTAVDMNWRRGRGERLLFQIGDEPPTTGKTDLYYRATADAAARGIQVFNVAASGVDDHLEFLMRQGSAITGGRYVFLTDDSGVGLAHAEPTISCYQVTRLNELLARLLRSELSGRRIEAARGDVIRTVGSYQNGRCVN